MRTTHTRRDFTCGLVLATGLLVSAAAAPAPDDDWPKEIEGPKVDLLIYQPQLESFEGARLTARAAVSVTPKGQTEPVFGAMWFDCRVETDRDERMVSLRELDVSRMRFPDATPEQEERLKALVEGDASKWNLQLSLDRLLASLEVIEKAKSAAVNLKFTPPVILFADYPSLLIAFDGEPQLSPVENTDLMRAVNTPYLVVLDGAARKYYLDGGQVWFVAESPKGPWTTTDAVPSKIVALRPPPDPDAEADPAAEDEPENKDDRIPRIVVATEPTELIVTDGMPTYTPIAGNELLYMANTESDVLVEIATQRRFVVLSGRWYASKTLSGPWASIAADALPASFAAIPEDSEKGYLRVFVAGTQEAKDAVLDQQIPQTSSIERSQAHLAVTYDGAPKFEPIEHTSMRYAVNTAFSVIQVDAKYYACYQAVWFVAGGPLGPWVIADEVPPEIYTVPPSCPVYNVKYVYVYGSTPKVVYVGYLPGYSGAYVYGGTIVYGTGYYYVPWYGTYYYARPATWGFHVRWNPWRGWSCGFSYSFGRVTIGIGFGRGGWWGPHGYRGYRRGYRHGYARGARAGYRAGQRSAHRNNMYSRSHNRARNAPRTRPATGGRPAAGSGRPTAATTGGRRNDVYADRNGNVHRRSDSGWQQRDGNSWSSSGRTADRSTRDRSSTTRSSLDRDHAARQRGTTRTQRSRSSGGRSRGGGGRRR